MQSGRHFIREDDAMEFVFVPTKFAMGKIVITPGAADQLTELDVHVSLCRHAQADWGDVDAEDWQANDQSLNGDARLLSAYRDENGVKFWIITEGDRSATTILLPEEY
jgi:hypothetical protein